LNDYLLAVLLGIIEGLTEFLPVSSTAHLRIAQAMLGVDMSSGYWKMFSVVIQLGAILCVPIYFQRRILSFVSTFPNGTNGDRNAATHPLTLTLVAFVVTAIPTALLTRVIGENLESLHVMAASLIVGGLVMLVVEALYERNILARIERRTSDLEKMSVGQAILIGASQVLAAVFPGTSRSMATIAGGQLVGMSRAAALEFSFFLSIPTMIAATGYDLLKALTNDDHTSSLGSAPANAHQWMVLAIGFLVSFVVAYAVVAWFMRFVRKSGFASFGIYRIIFGIIVFWWAMR